MKKIKSIQLISTFSSVGESANDGAYYPVGLLTIASAVNKAFPQVKISIHDQCHEEIVIDDRADLVGISATSSLCYENAMALAKEAKRKNKTVVLGGQYASLMASQILCNREEVDFVIRGKGEKPFIEFIRGDYSSGFPSLSWREGGIIVHGSEFDPAYWNYDDYAPLPLELLSSGIKKYWEKYKELIDPEFAANFLVFTHFGCLYKKRRTAMAKGYCCYCSLDADTAARSPQNILAEIKAYVAANDIPRNARIRLKCYGDNIGPRMTLAESLADEIEKCPWWNDYRFSWTFYCQSSFLSEKLAHNLKRIGTTDLFIGFDGVNNKIQKLNSLGTNTKTHWRAIEICKKYGIKIQASSVVGLIGETPKTLHEQYQFFKKLVEGANLERINSGVIVIAPGSLSYRMLVEKEPWLEKLDFFPIQEIQKLWIKHFCPQVSLSELEDSAAKIGQLSPGPRGCIGFNERRKLG